MSSHPPRSAPDDRPTAPVEDADPGDVDMMPELWGRALTSVPFALGLACWWIALAARLLQVIWHRHTEAAVVLCLVAATVLWSHDAGRGTAVFRGLPRAWDDPADPIRVDWMGKRRRRFPANRGFVHADRLRLRAAWGTVYPWDLLVVLGACIAIGAGDPKTTAAASMYTIGCALVLGLPRVRRVAVDLELDEVASVRVVGRRFHIRTTRSGPEADLAFSTYESDRRPMIVHLRAAFGSRVEIVEPPRDPPGLADSFTRPPG